MATINEDKCRENAKKFFKGSACNTYDEKPLLQFKWSDRPRARHLLAGLKSRVPHTNRGSNSSVANLLQDLMHTEFPPRDVVVSPVQRRLDMSSSRRREAIAASVCGVLHGRRVPGDAWGLDLASVLHGACESYNCLSQICSDTHFGELSLEHQLANTGCHTLPTTDHDMH